jgi:histidine triad (HIT) family protein
MGDCIFCDIVSGKRSGRKLYQDEWVTAFRDIHPVAPVHVLIVPNQHISSVNDLQDEDEQLISHMFSVARQVAGELVLEYEQDSSRKYFTLRTNAPTGSRGHN